MGWGSEPGTAAPLLLIVDWRACLKPRYLLNTPSHILSRLHIFSKNVNQWKGDNFSLFELLGGNLEPLKVWRTNCNLGMYGGTILRDR